MPYLVTIRVNEQSHAALLARVEGFGLESANGEGIISANVQVETVPVPPNMRVPDPSLPPPPLTEEEEKEKEKEK